MGDKTSFVPESIQKALNDISSCFSIVLANESNNMQDIEFEFHNHLEKLQTLYLSDLDKRQVEKRQVVEWTHKEADKKSRACRAAHRKELEQQSILEKKNYRDAMAKREKAFAIEIEQLKDTEYKHISRLECALRQGQDEIDQLSATNEILTRRVKKLEADLILRNSSENAFYQREKAEFEAESQNLQQQISRLKKDCQYSHQLLEKSDALRVAQTEKLREEAERAKELLKESYVELRTVTDANAGQRRKYEKMKKELELARLIQTKFDTQYQDVIQMGKIVEAFKTGSIDVETRLELKLRILFARELDKRQEMDRARLLDLIKLFDLPRKTQSLCQQYIKTAYKHLKPSESALVDHEEKVEALEQTAKEQADLIQELRQEINQLDAKKTTAQAADREKDELLVELTTQLRSQRTANSKVQNQMDRMVKALHARGVDGLNIEGSVQYAYENSIRSRPQTAAAGTTRRAIFGKNAVCIMDG